MESTEATMKPATMTIVELSQGYYSNLAGTPKDAAIEMFKANDEAFLEANPHCRKYHHPAWHVREVPVTQTAPWGYEWYVVDEAGALRLHSAQYDSSG